MIENRVAPVGETTVRFFSFFTILTNLVVAMYFSLQLINSKIPLVDFAKKPGALTAITVYITVVGLVYQIVLRKIWTPTGLQMVVDELLHSVMPLFVIVFWLLFEMKKEVDWKQLPGWLIYPFVYTIYILIRGNFSGFYPYPFVDVDQLGIQTVLINCFFLVAFFVILSAMFVGIAKLIAKNKIKAN